MSERIQKAAVVGGGVIGGGWAARFLLNGIDVAVADPDPEAERKIGEVVALATRAFARLTNAPPAPRGTLSFAGSVAEAVAGADYIQESAPERLELKRGLLAGIDRHAPADALIGSSTSGLLPSELQADMARPDRFFVAHPFNPVYLLPLVELVAGQRTAPETLTRASAILADLGMKPLVVRKEIDAFIGDRLLEAFWREALWLLHDDVATAEEIDDVVRYSFGLRWAQMGTFMVYRIAGGEAGMRHFIEQFGPALAWPWTKLTDVPDFTPALVDKIVAQSDAQAGDLSIRELERIRDDNLVAILQALRAQEGGRGWGAGALLKDWEDRQFGRAHADAAARECDPAKPLKLVETRVPADWTDYNGHMTESRYLQLFGDTTDALLQLVGVNKTYRDGGRSYYTVETHLRHLGEAKALEAVHVTTQMLGHDARRLHLFHTMLRTADGTVLATAEHLLLHVDTAAGRASPAGTAVLAKIAPIAAGHAALERPDGTGRAVGQPRT